MIEAYLADPCGTLSIPYYKMIRIQMPPQLRIIHDRAFDGVLDPGDTHRRYFRLLHTLSRLETPLLPPDYALRRIDERHSPQLASLLGTAIRENGMRLRRSGFCTIPLPSRLRIWGRIRRTGYSSAAALVRLTHNAVKGRSSGWLYIQHTGERD